MIDTLYHVDSFYIGMVEAEEIRAASDSIMASLIYIQQQTDLAQLTIESQNQRLDRTSYIYTIILAIVAIMAALFGAVAYFNIYKPLLTKEKKIDDMFVRSEKLVKNIHKKQKEITVFFRGQGQTGCPISTKTHI